MKKDLHYTEVFKIQRPILQSGKYRVLAYNKDRSIKGEFAPTKELMKMFKDDELKIYVFGYYDDKTGKINIIKKTDESAWGIW